MENYITKNRKDLSNMIFEILDLVETKDKKMRLNFRAEVFGYLSVLERINNINDINDSERLLSQFKFSQKLFNLCDRYKSNGLNQKQKDMPLDFIRGLQSKMLEVCEDGFSWELKDYEKRDAFEKAYDKIENEKTSRLEHLKSEALSKIGTKSIIKDFI